MGTANRVGGCWIACVDAADQRMDPAEPGPRKLEPDRAHLFWRVLPSALRLSVACQWFLTLLSVRPCSRRAMAVAARPKHNGSVAVAARQRVSRKEATVNNLRRQAGQNAPCQTIHIRKLQQSTVRTCPLVLVNCLSLQERGEVDSVSEAAEGQSSAMQQPAQ
jgi:hypothetical protein